MDRERYDDIANLAALVAGSPRPLLVGLDVDGVLAPIVPHPDRAALTPGVRGLITTISETPGVHVAIVSGRSIADLERFDFPANAHQIGSHGMEMPGATMRPLDGTERERLAALGNLASTAAASAGHGAWVEHKPASVVLHVREASRETAQAALDALRYEATSITGATAKDGSSVLELFARPASKADELRVLASALGPATTVFVGDDVTGEEAFAALGQNDVTIKVGAAETLATHRLRDTDAVAEWLADAAGRLAS